MKIAYQGIPGSYSSQAVHALSVHDAKPVGCETFDQVREQVENGALGVVPVENSYAGTIHRNIYNFLHWDHTIVGSLVLSINHCLLGVGGAKKEDIRVVYSHPQALAQTYEYCKKHNFSQHEAVDTAGAAHDVAELGERTHAAIASREAAEVYGLELLEESIQDQEGNQTRFLVIAHKKHDAKSISLHDGGNHKTALLFTVGNMPGVLYKCLGAFATHNIDLTKIESLPSQKDPFTYMFWVECDGDAKSKQFGSMLEELAFFTTEINVLGSYPVWEVEK